MKNIVYKSILLILVVMLLPSCDDFLKHTPYGEPTSNDFWSTEEDLQSALDAFYDYTYREGITGRGIYWFENCSDDLVTGRANVNADACKNFQMGASSGLDVKETWKYMYIMVAMANDIIRNVPGITSVSETMKNNALGQAYFFRAYGYLWLAPWYADNGPNGGLPIMTEEVTVDELDMARPASVLENYDMMIDDLRKAGELLPSFSQLTEDNYGRPYKTAAWAFAARAALYAAQYDSKYYSTVIEMCDKVINLQGGDKRGLFPDFKNLFHMDNNFSEEYIYSILGNELDGPKFHGMGFQNGGFGIHNTWGYFQPTVELYKAFEPGDVRRDVTILSPGQHITFIGNDIQWAVNPSEISSTTGLTGRKFMSIFEPADCIGKTVNTSGNNHSNRLGTVVMRYADILLMKAEALIWTKGEGDAEAINLLNQIRKRAGLPENSKATKAQLKNERRCELALEFLPSRHYDLVRWGDAQSVYAKPLHGFKVHLKQVDGVNMVDQLEEIEAWPARNFNPNVHHVFPIPADQVARGKNLTQNQGY
ncbi:RagB/SusD family nutrient uptake outer membrane protein [Parabacteroides sp. OttesenSCG-928-N08]|nr:RagB/SusD family nutrient uptake outer membrane protein [Parabacteroides sp. OttesenSCG-928-N08]